MEFDSLMGHNRTAQWLFSDCTKHALLLREAAVSKVQAIARCILQTAIGEHGLHLMTGWPMNAPPPPAEFRLIQLRVGRVGAWIGRRASLHRKTVRSYLCSERDTCRATPAGDFPVTCRAFW
jgi:hypothetical protein